MRSSLISIGALVAGILALLLVVPMVSSGPSQLGDANCDGTVNSIDAALVLQLHAALIREVCGDADMNGDGTANSIDALLILHRGLGVWPLQPLPTEQPTGEVTTYLRVLDLPSNEGITISLTLLNNNLWELERSYGTGQRYDVIVRDAKGDYVWNFWHDTPWTQAGESHVWEPGEWVTYDATWRFEDKAGNAVGPGAYQLHAFDLGCTTEPTRQCDLAETIAVDVPPPPDCTGRDGLGADLIVSGGRETFSSAQNVSLTLVLFNCGTSSETRGYSSSQMYDFVIEDEAGQVIWHSSYGLVFAQIIAGRTFEPGEMFVHRTIWQQDTNERTLLLPDLFKGGARVEPGSYEVFGFDVSTCRYDDLGSCDLIASQMIGILP